MHSQKMRKSGILLALVSILALPLTAAAGPTVKSVPQSMPPSKHFIQLQPGMQHTSFVTKNGMNKKQLISSLNLSSAKKSTQH